MPDSLVQLSINDSVAVVTLDDPRRRNAMSTAMFDALDDATSRIAEHESLRVVVLRGAGRAFCAGFDLAAAVDDSAVMGAFIGRLSTLNRTLRRLPQPVVAEVHGAALAGGCAVLSACDMVVVSPEATLGYPVHRIGVSPAVTIPLLRLAVGDGQARSLLLSGRLIDGAEAFRTGLATHLARPTEHPAEVGAADALGATAWALVRRLRDTGPVAGRATKSWLNELDGSLSDDRFDSARDASAALVDGEEAARMLQAFWAARAR